VGRQVGSHGHQPQPQARPQDPRLWRPIVTNVVRQLDEATTSERIKHSFSTTSSCMTAWRWRALFLLFSQDLLLFFRSSGIMAAAAEAKDNLSEKVPACHASISSPLNESAAKLCIFETRRKCGLFSFFPQPLDWSATPNPHLSKQKENSGDREGKHVRDTLVYYIG